MARAPRFVILAEGSFGAMSSKTANACIRYSPERVAAVVDSHHAGETAESVLGFGGAIPVLASLGEALALRPTALLIGIAPQGGGLPDSWRATIAAALDRRLAVWSGLHVVLGDDPDFAALARHRGVEIRDLRKPPPGLDVAQGRVRKVAATVVLTVGTDCNVGKMTSALQIRDGLRRLGRRVAFAGTGQTGILVEGWGIAVDAVVADFVAGAAERLVLDASRGTEIVLVEGQGSIIHPGYSGVTYGLLHGSLPHAMVLCAQPSRTTISNNSWVKIPPLDEVIALHEAAVSPLRPAKVVAVALNTYDMGDARAKKAIAAVERETGLPVTDCVRYDPAPVVQAIDRVHQARRRARRRARTPRSALTR
ncbi:MAG: DUF1611 domain-containing protein [Gemmatimonadaceae bacterium]